MYCMYCIIYCMYCIIYCMYCIIYCICSRYWPIIDDALRACAYDRGVQVRLLVSQWNHTSSSMVFHLRSLLALSGITKKGIEIVKEPLNCDLVQFKSTLLPSFPLFIVIIVYTIFNSPICISANLILFKNISLLPSLL